MSFIHDNFLLETKAAQRLFHTYAAPQPIIDYHCHLPPKDVADDRRFANLFEIWLEGDHYKWRAMRASGVAEKFCTGDAAPRDKFLAWAKTVPQTLRNPLYHWTHLELKRYFGIDELLDETTADGIWDRANEALKAPQLSAKGILGKFCVRAVCTTDDPARAADPSRDHRRVRPAHEDLSDVPGRSCAGSASTRRVQPVGGQAGEDRGRHIARFQDLLDALAQTPRCLPRRWVDGCPTMASTSAMRPTAPTRRRRPSSRRLGPVMRRDAAGTRSIRVLHDACIFGRLDAEKGWTKQLHLGARRNANTRALKSLGRDTGYDSIGDLPQVDGLGDISIASSRTTRSRRWSSTT